MHPQVRRLVDRDDMETITQARTHGSIDNIRDHPALSFGKPCVECRLGKRSRHDAHRCGRQNGGLVHGDAGVGKDAITRFEFLIGRQDTGLLDRNGRAAATAQEAGDRDAPMDRAGAQHLAAAALANGPPRPCASHCCKPGSPGSSLWDGRSSNSSRRRNRKPGPDRRVRRRGACPSTPAEAQE
jgi:hypothetical protein